MRMQQGYERHPPPNLWDLPNSEFLKMEISPWWSRLSGPFPAFEGPVGVKADGGGSIRGTGWVGLMLVHRAVCNRDAPEIERLVKAERKMVNEVEAAGNTPCKCSSRRRE